jgi:hypothetical protein
MRFLLKPAGLGSREGRKLQFQLARNWTAEPGFEVPSFGALYLSNRAELERKDVLGTLA